MSKRRLRSALEIVSDIGALGYDLQHHSDEQIAVAVALLRGVNPALFQWLLRALGRPVSDDAVARPAASEAEPPTRDKASS